MAAASTRSLYSCKWCFFEKWCRVKNTFPFHCSVVELLCFLQDLVDEGGAFSIIMMYTAAISSCHVGFGDESARHRPQAVVSLKELKLAVSRPLVPLWDLSIVLEAFGWGKAKVGFAEDCFTVG